MSLIITVFWLPFAQAMDTPEKEIQHLFEFISHSDCIFIHNNSENPANKARDHMQTKYNYAKRWVESAEQFIEHMASNSSVSGARYQVRYQRRLS